MLLGNTHESSDPLSRSPTFSGRGGAQEVGEGPGGGGNLSPSSATYRLDDLGWGVPCPLCQFHHL